MNMNPRQHAPGHGVVALRVDVFNLPTDWDTGKVYKWFEKYGTLTKIEIRESSGNEASKTQLIFAPPPTNTEWIARGTVVGNRPVRFSPPQYLKMYRHKSVKNPSREFSEEIRIPGSELSFGIMESEDHMLVLHSATGRPMDLELNLKRKVLDLDFRLINTSKKGNTVRLFKMRLTFPQLRDIVELYDEVSGRRAWILSLEHPPQMFRKADHIEHTHESGSTFWHEWQTWYRQTEINTTEKLSTNPVTQLQKESTCIDIGRWLTYRLIFERDVIESKTFRNLCEALKDHDIAIKRDKIITFGVNNSKDLWSWLDNSIAILNSVEKTSLSELHQMADEAIHLPFEVRYQLEVCISHGLLHECNIGKDFLKRLAALKDQQTNDKRLEFARATRLLEKVADEKARYYVPEDVFRRLLYKVSVVTKPPPAYCARVRAAIITPTTIYFITPLSETSNRVIRKFQHYEDRFLRVKFTDERYKGKVQSFQDCSMNEIYTRIKRTMANGIQVGDRHYEFLAFGNSQFREHGAWFFASTSDLTAQQIRDRIGDFSHINNVAKYCSRIGQCFSTSRATSYSFDIIRIPDIERNGFRFSDGVGKISKFLARMIAQDLGRAHSDDDYPSAFQFRREGCKGILVVDPALTGPTVQIRQSQEKFSGTSHHGLEIVRISQYSTAYLNVQLILVLSALGVEDHIFVRKMGNALRELEEAMDNEEKAVELLSKNIDYNHMTIQLASILLDGFMENDDPFTISCLRLWRAWRIKYLKEKARICVENGAFVLGCVDEIATLKGHTNDAPGSDEDVHDEASLPEIFLQIDATGEGKWQIIEGVCILARNPSLHPGDVRIVRAVNVEALRHIKNCVVFPQTGDRDLGNMCSGGDLDGDDYLVMWDKDLMPKEWNHPPMDYTAPEPIFTEGQVTVDDMTSFFVTHMKHDNLGPIAVAHKYWADRQPDGVKDPICLELARLHSMAVDYAKTGVPAKFPKSLRVQSWPHWSEPRKGKPWYTSQKVIGQLYEEVQRVPFEPAWHLPFDQRILEAYPLDDETLEAAQEIKSLYDAAMQRVMSKFSIASEFEVWSTFVLYHSDDMGDYKFAETIGEASSVLKDEYQRMCYEKAGTNSSERDWTKMSPFIAAMYRITADEVTAALIQHQAETSDEDDTTPDRSIAEKMPFISFPWLFPAELGRIANKREDWSVSMPRHIALPRIQQTKKTLDDLLDDDMVLPKLDEIQLLIKDAREAGDPGRRDSMLFPESRADH